MLQLGSPLESRKYRICLVVMVNTMYYRWSAESLPFEVKHQGSLPALHVDMEPLPCTASPATESRRCCGLGQRRTVCTRTSECRHCSAFGCQPYGSLSLERIGVVFHPYRVNHPLYIVNVYPIPHLLLIGKTFIYHICVWNMLLSSPLVAGDE